MKVAAIALLFLSLLCQSCLVSDSYKEYDEHYYKRLFEANRAIQRKKFDKALKITDAILGDYENDPSARLLKIRILYYTRKFKDAKESAESLLEAHPDHQGALIWLGRIYALTPKNLKKAEEYFKKALRNNPEDNTALYNLARIYERQGDVKNALRYYTLAQRMQYDLEVVYDSTMSLLKKQNLTDRLKKLEKKRNCSAR